MNYSDKVAGISQKYELKSMGDVLKLLLLPSITSDVLMSFNEIVVELINETIQKVISSYCLIELQFQLFYCLRIKPLCC